MRGCSWCASRRPETFDPTRAQSGGVTIHLLWGDRCELVPHIVFDGGNILFLWQRSSKVDQLGLSDYHFLRVCHSCLEGEDQCSRSKQKSFHRPRARKRSEEHASELQSLMRNSYAVFCLKKKKQNNTNINKREERHTTQNI